MPGYSIIRDLRSIIFCFRILCEFDLSPVYLEFCSPTLVIFTFPDLLSYSIFQSAVLHNNSTFSLGVNVQFLSFFTLDCHNLSFRRTAWINWGLSRYTPVFSPLDLGPLMSSCSVSCALWTLLQGLPFNVLIWNLVHLFLGEIGEAIFFAFSIFSI